MEAATIIVLAESCHNLVERFTPLVEEIRRHCGTVRIIGFFIGFELGAQHMEDGGLFEESYFFAEPRGVIPLVGSIAHHLMIVFINHNVTFRDSKLYATGIASPHAAYVFRNTIRLNRYLMTGDDDGKDIRSAVARARRENGSIQVRSLLLTMLAAAIICPVRLFRCLTPARHVTKKILFIKLDVLGDMIVTLPYLAALRTAFIDAELTLLASSRGAAIVREQQGLYPYGLCDHLLVWDAPWHTGFPRLPGFGAVRQLLRRLPSFWMQHYDLVVQPVNFGTGIVFAVLTLGKRVVSIIDSRLPLAMLVRPFVTDPIVLNQERIYHLGEFSDLALSRLGVTTDPAAPGLLISDQARGKVEQFLTEHGYRKEFKLLLFNVGAGHPLRVWGAPKFAQLAEKVGARHEVMIVLTGSQQEREMAAEIGKQSCFPLVNSAGLLSLNELVALASMADLMVTVDTGIMHLAAAVNTPLVAIFGAGLVDYCKPLSQNYVIVKHELGCSGCADRCFVPQQPPCIEQITVAQVHEALEHLLERHKRTIGN